MSEPPHRAGPFAPPERARLRQALIELATDGGLESVSAAALCERAGYAPERFAEEFGDVRGCAMAVYLADIDDFGGGLDAAADPADPWRERLRTSAYFAARYIRDRPRAARFDVLAMLEGGELAQAHRDRYVRRPVELIDEGRLEAPDPGSLSPAVAEAVFGSIYQTLARELGSPGGGVEPDQFVPQLMYIAVRPYLGEEAAREELTIPPPPERPGESR